MVICGTKVDLTKKRIISYKEAKNFALDKNMEYFEISSKTGEGIELMFDKILKIKLSEPEFIKLQVKPAIIFEEKYEILRLSDNNNYNNGYKIGCCQQYY
jgi:GTPase SAR1 family protein